MPRPLCRLEPLMPADPGGGPRRYVISIDGDGKARLRRTLCVVDVSGSTSVSGKPELHYHCGEARLTPGLRAKLKRAVLELLNG